MYYDNMQCGVLKETPDKQDFKAGGIIYPDIKLPDKFRIRSDNKFPIKNQFQRSSCTSQALTACHEPDENMAMSARFQFVLTKRLEGNKGYGAYLSNSLKVMQKYGAIPESMLPESEGAVSYEDYLNEDCIVPEMLKVASLHKIGSYWSVNDSNFKKVLYQFNKDLPPEKQKGIYMAIDWWTGFNHPKNGYLPVMKDWGLNVGGHAIILVGFFEDYYIFRNSWGEGWGDKGYFYSKYLPSWSAYAFKDEKGFPVENRYGKKYIPSFYLEEKKILFNPWLKNKIHRQPNQIEIIALAIGRHDYHTVFEGLNGEAWLYWTKEDLIKRGFNYKTKK